MVEFASTESLDAVFGALADPTRREVIATLRRGSATVTQLAEPLPMSLNAVSKHVKVLEAAGLVRREVVGREHRIHLHASRLAAAAAWMDHYREFWETRMDALDSFLRERGE